MLWLGLCFPELALQVCQRSVADPLLALCDRLQVLLASAPAQAAGVQSGMRRATAQALAPDLLIIERDPHREREALEQLAICALQFTPTVCLVDDHPGIESGLLLEVAPSLRLFDGLPKLLARLRGQLGELGFDVRISQAPTAAGAWLMALHPGGDGHTAPDLDALRGHLDQLPVDLLKDAQAHLTTMGQIGLHRIGQLQRLPRAGLSRRFGAALLRELDHALGTAADPRITFEAPLQFEARLELPAQIEHAEALLFAARRLLVQLSNWLTARHRGLREAQLVIEHDDHEATVATLRTADATRDAVRLVALLREQLTTLTLPEPAHTLRLRCNASQPLAAPDTDLFGGGTSLAEGLGPLIERLQARLGRDHVQQLHLADDHRPEAAYRVDVVTDVGALVRAGEPARSTRSTGASRSAGASRASGPTRPRSARPGSAGRSAVAMGSPASGATTAASAIATAECAETSRVTPSAVTTSVSIVSKGIQAAPEAPYRGHLPRPLWLLDQPVALDEKEHRPCWRTPLNLLAGPERIETGWWDGNLIQRDYFIAEDHEHALYWIYRERLPDPSSGRGWFLQGLFG